MTSVMPCQGRKSHWMYPPGMVQLSPGVFCQGNFRKN